MPVSGTAAFDTSLLTLLRQTVEGLEQGSADAPPPKPGTTAKSSQAAPSAPVGTGSTAPVGDAPDISANNAATAPGNTNMAVAVASMFSMMPASKSDDDTEVELASIEAKMKQTTDQVGKNEITANQERQRNALTAKKEQLEKAQKAMDAAADAQKHASVWDKVKLAFSYVGALLTVAAGILMVLAAPVTGGLGAVAGGLLIASGVMMFMMAVDQTMAIMPSKDGKPREGFIAMTAQAITKDMYPGDTDKQTAEAAKWTMGLTCALMVASAICGIAGAVVNPAGAAAELAELPSLVGEVSETVSAGTEIADAGTTVASTADEVATVSETAEQVETGVTDGVETGSDLETAASAVDDGTGLGTTADGASSTTTKAEEVEELAEEGTEAAEDAEKGAKNVDSAQKSASDDGSTTNASAKSDQPATATLRQRIAENVAVGSKAKTATGIAEGVNDAANAGADGPSLYYHYEASTATGTSLQNKAQAKEFEALDKFLDDAIDAIMLRLKTDGDRFSSVLGNLADAVKDHGNSMSNIRFRA